MDRTLQVVRVPEIEGKSLNSAWTGGQADFNMVGLGRTVLSLRMCGRFGASATGLWGSFDGRFFSCVVVAVLFSGFPHF